MRSLHRKNSKSRLCDAVNLEEPISSCGDDDDTGDQIVSIFNNKIYFYSSIDAKTIFSLKEKINVLNIELAIQAMEYEGFSPVIYLHINSPGGLVTDSFLGIDSIRQSRVPIYTVVDGIANSGGTLLSLAGKKRFINENSTMLIHQLSGASWGTYRQMEDEYINSKLSMEKIQKYYEENTKLSAKQIKRLLNHDLDLDAKKCLKYGLVDEIIGSKK